MITRIKINGFKSLLNTELYLGPFTCIAGANAAGKSNFFDALVFLSHLADKTIIEATKSIRSESQMHSDLKDIFFRSGELSYKQMEFEVDMLVPRSAEDDLGQKAETSVSSLRYKLVLKLNEINPYSELLPIEILEESLIPMTRQDAKKSLGFEYSKEWANSVFFGRKSSKIISTEGGKIKLHQDTHGKSGGRAAEFIASKMPRTLLSTVTAESPTAFLVRQEMRNWQMLQFEPSALRKPSSFHDVLHSKVDAHGGNIAATLTRLSQNDEVSIFQSITNLLTDLITGVKGVNVEEDEKRELLTLTIVYKSGLTLPAQSLSDGTLRFIALSVIYEDSRNSLICMEEPENGINPQKISAIVELLERLSFNPFEAIDEQANPLRQVIINTHSPKLIEMVPDNSLYLASTEEMYNVVFKKKVNYTKFYILPDTYKKKKYNSFDEISLGEMRRYLDDSLRDHIYNVNRMKYSKKKTVRENILEQEKGLFD